MNIIRVLQQHEINQISAGEVIERPASAVKELVENSIDAGASEVRVWFDHGGKSLICVEDDGAGMSKEDLLLCTKRHATSKLQEYDLFNISTFGFRGEALAAICASARVHITTKHKSEPHAWSLLAEGGEIISIEPAQRAQGTKVEIRDLFFSTPARLRFLRSDDGERAGILSVLESAVISFADVSWSVSYGKKFVKYPKVDSAENMRSSRIAKIFGQEFCDSAIEIEESAGEFQVSGWLGSPNVTRASSERVFLFVNDRPVKDKFLCAIIKAAYSDLIAKDRYPMAIVQLRVPLDFVDVNVHPAKTEVRFKNSVDLRGFIVSVVKKALYECRANRSVPDRWLGRSAVAESSDGVATGLHIKNNDERWLPLHEDKQRLFLFNSLRRDGCGSVVMESDSPSEALGAGIARNLQGSVDPQEDLGDREHCEVLEQGATFHLGKAVCQIDNSYIVARNENGIVIVDQHAAHERVCYERAKKIWGESSGAVRTLFVPMEIDLSSAEAIAAASFAGQLESSGFSCAVEHGKNAVKLSSFPEVFMGCDVKQVLIDILDALVQRDKETEIAEWVLSCIHKILANVTCKNSVKFGRKLSIEEMDALLRSIESTQNSYRCNHGRPAYFMLSTVDIAKLFDRV
ncbi:DNA mismatch repair endonuclease MutL [Candidatus Hydrogenosomobacter endosymbioticus]|uniref:DNA mismatch repair endonuclease MutL n=1 Tax=Candidatus Hydrogenosomobacter endosymbioticus TaxID=2558174 RepID=UPI001F0300D7|nr:DNA mismatch repair endonuclease MutL [Candidatus Hydrogenosomobacter endosymbioticus]